MIGSVHSEVGSRYSGRFHCQSNVYFASLGTAVNSSPQSIQHVRGHQRRAFQRPYPGEEYQSSPKSGPLNMLSAEFEPTSLRGAKNQRNNLLTQEPKLYAVDKRFNTYFLPR